MRNWNVTSMLKTATAFEVHFIHLFMVFAQASGDARRTVVFSYLYSFLFRAIYYLKFIYLFYLIGSSGSILDRRALGYNRDYIIFS